MQANTILYLSRALCPSMLGTTRFAVLDRDVIFVLGKQMRKPTSHCMFSYSLTSMTARRKHFLDNIPHRTLFTTGPQISAAVVYLRRDTVKEKGNQDLGNPTSQQTGLLPRAGGPNLPAFVVWSTRGSVGGHIQNCACVMAPRLVKRILPLSQLDKVPQ